MLEGHSDRVRAASFRAQGWCLPCRWTSELTFRLATIGAFREAFKTPKGVILEPMMNVEVVAPMLNSRVRMQIYISFVLFLIFFGDSRSSYWWIEHSSWHYCWQRSQRWQVQCCGWGGAEWYVWVFQTTSWVYSREGWIQHGVSGSSFSSLLVYCSSGASLSSITGLFCQIFRGRISIARHLLLKSRQYIVN